MINSVFSPFNISSQVTWGFPGGASGKDPPANEGDISDVGLIPGWERSPRGGPGNPLQYSCLENPMDRGAWWPTVHGVTDSDTTEVTEHALTGNINTEGICVSWQSDCIGWSTAF